MSIKILRKFLSLNGLGKNGVRLVMGPYTGSLLFDNKLFLGSKYTSMHNLLFYNRVTFNFIIDNTVSIDRVYKEDFINEDDAKLILEYGRRITDENLLLEYNKGLPESWHLKISDFDDFLIL